MSGVTVPLTTPIQAHGAPLTALSLREPCGRDIAACGLPRSFARRGDTSSMVVDAAAVHAYIVRLGNIPPTSADQLSASDWMDVMGAVLGFFAPGAPQPAPPAEPPEATATATGPQSTTT